MLLIKPKFRSTLISLFPPLKNRTQIRFKSQSYNRALKTSLKYVRRRKFKESKIKQLNSKAILPPTFISSNKFSNSRYDYTGMCFAARKMLREYYYMKTEKELKRYYKDIVGSKMRYRTDCHVKFIDLLERRLDVFCFKVGFFDSMLSSRAGIRAGWVSVGNREKRVEKYSLKDGDYLSLNFSKRFRYSDVVERVRGRIEMFDLRSQYVGAIASHLNYRNPHHEPMRHFDLNYTTMTVHYRRSITGPEDMLPMGSVFGDHNDLFKAVQYYWWSYLCKC